MIPPHYSYTYIKSFCTKHGIPFEHGALSDRDLYDILVMIIFLLRKYAIHALLFSTVVELYTLFRIDKARKDKQHRKISESAYKREILKRGIGSLSAILGTTIGCA
ncbi:hypothetical protein MHBO_004299, partial [Bonamia ostreae]